MEMLPRITRRFSRKLLKEKSLPNRLQRLTTGGFKRKAEFLALTENKRRKRAKAISPSTYTKSVLEEAQLQKGKLGLSEYSVDNEEVQIFVELPVDQALSANTLKMIAEVWSVSDDEDHKPLIDLTEESGLDCEVNVHEECVSFEFRPFVLSLEIDTDSEDQSTLNLGKMVEGGVHKYDEAAVTSKPKKPLEEPDSIQRDVVQVFDKMPAREVEVAQVFDKLTYRGMPDAQVLDKMDPIKMADAQVLDKMAPREIADAQVFDKVNKSVTAAAQVFHEKHEGEITNAQACNGSGSLLGYIKEESETGESFLGLDSNKGAFGSGSLLGHVKEESEIEGSFLGLGSHKGAFGSDSLLGYVKEEPEIEESFLGLDSKKVALEREGTGKVEKLRRLCRSGPGSKWLYSGSRFAAYLRSAVGVIDLDPEEPLLQNNGKANLKQKLDAIEGGCAVGSPPKRQSARFPGKRKVALSPSSQLKLLEASKSSSYRRMLPFCTELAKDLAMASSAQSTAKMSPRADCIAPKECDMCTDKGLNREALLLEHIKGEENESVLASVTCDQGLSSGPVSRAHVELDHDGIQREFPTSSEEMSREPQCVGHVKLERNESQTESAISDEEMIMQLPCTGQVKVEENDIQMEVPSSDEDMSRDPLRAGHVKLQQSGFQMEFVPSNEEFSREPLATKHAKLKENVSNSLSAINNSLSCAGLSIGEVKLEQSGSQLELIPSDQCLSRKSLFVEHVKPDQNGNQSDSATSDHSLSRESFSTRCIEPERTECQFKSASNQLESSTICHSNGPSDLGKNVVGQSSSKSTSSLFSNGHCFSPLPMHKSPTLDADNTSLVDHKSPSPSLSDSADCTLFPTHGEVPSPLHTPASVPSKGILKVSPRSCKGVCLCSDCASFRLQAERASEFSERQLRETEALAVALMNELGNVRNVMDKYLITKRKGARIPYSIPHSQLKVVSRSALRAEETARDQLVQMTRDCNLHCKILRMQQRRVKFADKVEVKMFKSE